jgi:hypothetical protein
MLERDRKIERHVEHARGGKMHALDARMLYVSVSEKHTLRFLVGCLMLLASVMLA